MDSNLLSQFHGKKYINIESYRKSGDSVKTPVWFVEDNGCLYVRTGASSGKVKRIRRNSQTKIVPCSMRGDPAGAWVAANAEVLADPQLTDKIEQLLKKKYGLQKTLFEFFGRGSKPENATLKFQLAE
jgi:PPOX class probable F420-dependent enzyme